MTKHIYFDDRGKAFPEPEEEPSWENGKLRTWKEQMDDDYQELILLRTDNEKLQADNTRLRQQLQSLVEAWNRYWKREEDGTLIERLNMLHAAFLAVQSAQETEEKLVCRWTRDIVDEPWSTDCDNLFEFNVDGPRENQFKYCPYCGKVIEAQP